MKSGKLFLLIGTVMMILLFGFIWFAMNHPEMSFVGGNQVGLIIHIIYLFTTILMFVLARKKR